MNSQGKGRRILNGCKPINQSNTSVLPSPPLRPTSMAHSWATIAADELLVECRNQRGRASPKGFERGLNQRGFGLTPPLTLPLKPPFKSPLLSPPPGAPGRREETKVNPNRFGFHFPPFKPKGVWFKPSFKQKGSLV